MEKTNNECRVPESVCDENYYDFFRDNHNGVCDLIINDTSYYKSLNVCMYKSIFSEIFSKHENHISLTSYA